MADDWPGAGGTRWAPATAGLPEPGRGGIAAAGVIGIRPPDGARTVVGCLLRAAPF